VFVIVLGVNDVRWRPPRGHTICLMITAPHPLRQRGAGRGRR